MEQFNFFKLKNQLLSIIKESLNTINKSKNLNIKNKELNDIATFADEFIESELSNYLSTIYPNHHIIGEENGENNVNSLYEWLIDPIDGTVNYASNLPFYGTSVALRYNHDTIFGLIYDIPNDDVYYVIKGIGAFKNNDKLHVSKKCNLNESIITICLTSSYDEQLTNNVLEIIKKLQPHVRGIRIIVCTTYELIWVASGITEAMINIKPSIGVGSACGKQLVIEAGGKVTNTKGKARNNIDNLLVSNGLVHDEIVKIINS